MESRPVLYLIDGHALAYRWYYALQSANLTTSKGESTSAITGFFTRLLDIYEKQEANYIAVTFDEGLSGRDEIYPEYKSNRSEMPSDLASQFDRIRDLVEAFNIPRLTMPNMEADDVLGTISRQAVEQGWDVLIDTGDRDILQLVEPHIRVQLPGKRGKVKEYDVDAVKQEYALQPKQLIDLKALVGDPSDNFKGVPGVGKKTAPGLLQKYGDLDGIYENVDDVSPRIRNKLIANKELAYLCRELATIKCDLDIRLELDAKSLQFDLKDVENVITSLDFGGTRRQRLIKVYEDIHHDEGESRLTNAHDVIDTVIVRSRRQLQILIQELNRAGIIAFDTETTSIDQMSAKLVGISLAVDDKIGYYVPVGHGRVSGQGQIKMFAEPAGEQLPLDAVIEALRDPLENQNIPKTAHNAIYDYMILRRYGITVSPIEFDTMIAEWMSNPVSRFLKLKALVAELLEVQMTEISELLGKGRNQKTMDRLEIEKAAPYAAADATMTLRLVEPLRSSLQENRLEQLYQSLELPLIPIISSMQFKGVTLDVEFLKEMSGGLELKLQTLATSIFEAGGAGEFNINSPKQLNRVLFEELNLPVRDLETSEHGYSTDMTTLELLRDEHEIIKLLIDFRELSKLKSTYVDALPILVNPVSGRVHTSYNQAGSATGRFSSSNPNLQNIPVRTALGREVRRAFVAPEGYLLLAVDYSQIELRVMAHISQDETLIDAFHQELDIHQATAATVNGIEPEEVTYEQRSFAKRVNFGLMYGMGAFRLARDSDLTLAEAEAFIKTYFERMPGVKEYIDRTKAEVWEKGYTETLYGRRRIYPAIKANGNRRSTAAEERAAINMPIQGTAADILKQSMIDLDARLAQSDYDAAMILQVHDELVLEVNEDQLDAVSSLVVETMEAALPDGQPLRVPLRANASSGANWRDMDDII